VAVTLDLDGPRQHASAGTGRPADVIDALLAEVLAGTRPDCLVVFGLSRGLRQLVEASEARCVTAADRMVTHARAAAGAVRGIEGVTVCVSDGISHLGTRPQADAVAVRVPKEKQAGLQLIWDAFQILEAGGRLYIAGATRDGIKSYLAYAAELFGGAHTLAIRKGSRVGMAVRSNEAPPTPASFDSRLLDHRCYRTFAVDVRDHRVEVHSRPGVFTWDRLDGGTRALIETLKVDPTDRVLDLGCGHGIVGVVASALAPRGCVTMVDADIVAVEAAKRTVAANDCTNCDVTLADGATDLATDSFDVVAVNPPFHLDRRNDYRTAERFVADAARVLRPGGRLFLVANRFLPYEANVRDVFGEVERAFDDRSYKVLAATKQVGAP
jgi:16S rRNA (guanine1207-N2)-methyltransferase